MAENKYDFLQEVATVQNMFIELFNKLENDGYVANIGPVNQAAFEAMEPAPSQAEIDVYLNLKPYLVAAYNACKDVSLNQAGSIANII